MPRQQTSKCRVCEKTVSTSPRSLPEPTCRECRSKSPSPYGRKPKSCDRCGADFVRRSNSSRKCCYDCRPDNRGLTSHRVCPCGAEFQADKINWNRKHCAECRATAAWLPKRTTPGRPGLNARQRRRKYGVPYESFRNVDIFRRDNWLCGICGEDVDPALTYPDRMSASLDHVVPLSAPGGPGHVRSNVQCSHWICNVRRGAPDVVGECGGEGRQDSDALCFA